MTADLLTRGMQALDRGDWPAATEAFGASLQEQETAEALDGLGQARWWQNELDPAIELRSRAPLRRPHPHVTQCPCAIPRGVTLAKAHGR